MIYKLNKYKKREREREKEKKIKVIIKLWNILVVINLVNFKLKSKPSGHGLDMLNLWTYPCFKFEKINNHFIFNAFFF